MASKKRGMASKKGNTAIKEGSMYICSLNISLIKRTRLHIIHYKLYSIMKIIA